MCTWFAGYVYVVFWAHTWGCWLGVPRTCRSSSTSWTGSRFLRRAREIRRTTLCKRLENDQHYILQSCHASGTSGPHPFRRSLLYNANVPQHDVGKDFGLRITQLRLLGTLTRIVLGEPAQEKRPKICPKIEKPQAQQHMRLSTVTVAVSELMPCNMKEGC